MSTNANFYTEFTPLPRIIKAGEPGLSLQMCVGSDGGPDTMLRVIARFYQARDLTESGFNKAYLAEYSDGIQAYYKNKNIALDAVPGSFQEPQWDYHIASDGQLTLSQGESAGISVFQYLDSILPQYKERVRTTLQINIEHLSQFGIKMAEAPTLLEMDDEPEASIPASTPGATLD